jgi:hypothetical protein
VTTAGSVNPFPVKYNFDALHVSSQWFAKLIALASYPVAPTPPLPRRKPALAQ